MSAPPKLTPRAGLSSIRGGLLWRVVLIILLTWSAAAAFSYQGTRREIFQTFDNNLALNARILLAQVVHEIHEVGLENVRQEFDSILEDAQGTEFGKETEFLIYGKAGDLLMATHNAPKIEGQALVAGFSDQLLQGHEWRVYTHFNKWSGISIRGVELLSKRRKLMEYIAVQTLYPIAFALPIIGMLLWLGVGGGLRPLHQLVSAVRKRHGENLNPLEMENTPAEIAPLVLELNLLMARLQESLKTEKQLTANAAHELRTPLAGLKINTQVALRSSPGADQDMALKNIDRSIDRISRMIDQVLTLARVEQVTRDTDEHFELISCVEQVVEELRPLANRASIQFDLPVVHGECSSPVRGCRSDIELLLYNLLENAIKYSAEGGLIALLAESTAAGLKLEIIDNGPGVPVNELPNIEQRFYRVPGSAHEGSGLGLAIGREIADQNHIQMTFENISPHGLKVTLLFPSL